MLEPALRPSSSLLKGRRLEHPYLVGVLIIENDGDQGEQATT